MARMTQSQLEWNLMQTRQSRNRWRTLYWQEKRARLAAEMDCQASLAALVELNRRLAQLEAKLAGWAAFEEKYG